MKTLTLIGADYTGTVAGLATALQDENYGYDDNGNRLNANGTSRSPDGTDNRLQTNGTHRFAYDAEGNRTAKFIDNGNGILGPGDTDITEYTWDHRNRLTKITERDTYTSAVDKVIDYLYDVFDRRVSKTVDPDGVGGQTAYRDFYVYDGPHIALEFHDSDANGSSVAVVSHRYLHGPRIDMILADEQIVSGSGPGQVFWALPDHLGSTRDVINSSGNIVTHFVYNTFGQITGETNPNFKFRFTFTGRERDAETPDLMYYRARYYSTTEGVFISNDPIGFSGDPSNQYRYVENQPTTLTDPSGLKPPARPLASPSYSGPYNPYIRGEFYERNASLPYYHPRISPDGRLTGRGHSLNQISRAAQIRQQQELSRNANFVARQQLSRAYRDALEYAKQVGMTNSQISDCTRSSGSTQNSIVLIRERANAIRYESIPRNYRGDPVRIPKGHVMSPRDPAMSAPPIIERGPYTTAQRDAFLKGTSGGTRLSPHHRHQIPTTHGGVIDELPGPCHPAGNIHTAGSPSRHPSPSLFNSLQGGNALRSSEIRSHWESKGQRLLEVELGVWIDPGS